MRNGPLAIFSRMGALSELIGCIPLSGWSPLARSGGQALPCSTHVATLPQLDSTFMVHSWNLRPSSPNLDPTDFCPHDR